MAPSNFIIRLEINSCSKNHELTTVLGEYNKSAAFYLLFDASLRAGTDAPNKFGYK